MNTTVDFFNTPMFDLESKKKDTKIVIKATEDFKVLKMEVL